MGMKYIYMSSHMLLHIVELQWNDVKHFKNVLSDPVGCTSISQHLQLLGKRLFVAVLINAVFVPRLKW